MTLPRRFAVRRLQIGFLVLLAVCSAQTGWWLLDQVRFTNEVQALAAAEHAPASVLAQLERERFHRLNRYAWEGAFFLVVLAGAMAVVMHALREEAELRRRQEDFVAAVSHELRSPVASLKLGTETLALRDPPAARRAELLERQLADLGRLERMIGNILDASRLGHSAQRAAPSVVNLDAAVAAAVDEVHAQAAEHSVTMTTVIEPDLEVRADADGTRTILRNLLHNAIRAAAGGRVVVSAARENGRVRLVVRDTGVGFPAAEGERLFEKFYRLDGARRGRLTGTGLGLFLVRRYAELDGASVRAESGGPGRGATFTVSWPREVTA